MYEKTGRYTEEQDVFKKQLEVSNFFFFFYYKCNLVSVSENSFLLKNFCLIMYDKLDLFQCTCIHWSSMSCKK